MRYYKDIQDGIILAIGVGIGGAEITEVEYKNIVAAIQNRPTAKCKGYRLKTDLTWEEYDLPPVPDPSDEDELSDAEALNIIVGVTA